MACDCRRLTTLGEHRYQILVAGELPDVAREAFEGWTIEPIGADTAVSGNMDQAALHGALARIRGLCLGIVEVRRLRRLAPAAAIDDDPVGAPEPTPT